MAADAAALNKQGIPLLLRFIDGVFLTQQIAVERAVGGDQGTLIEADGVTDSLQGDPLWIDRELLHHLRIGLQSRDDLLDLAIHLLTAEQRPLYLFKQGWGTAIPELAEVEGGIEYGGGIAGQRFVIGTGGDASWVVPANGDQVTTDAGNILFAGEAHISKQRPPQCHFLL